MIRGITNFFMAHGQWLNSVTVILAIIFVILALMAFNSGFFNRKERSYYGFSFLGVAVCNIAFIFKGTPLFASPIVPIALIIACVMFLFLIIWGVIRRQKYYAKTNEHAKDIHDTLNDNPKLLHQIEEFGAKARKSHKYNGTIDLSPELNKKVEEAVKKHNAHKKSK